MPNYESIYIFFVFSEKYILMYSYDLFHFFKLQTSHDGTTDFKFQNSIFASFRSILSLHVTNLPRFIAVGVVVSIGLSAAADDRDGCLAM